MAISLECHMLCCGQANVVCWPIQIPCLGVKQLSLSHDIPGLERWRKFLSLQRKLQAAHQSGFSFLKNTTPLLPPWVKAREPLGGANDWLSFHSLIFTTNCLHSPPNLGCRLRVFNYLHGNGWTRNCLPFKQFTEESNCVSSFHVRVLPCEGKGASFNLPADRAVEKVLR